jgi:DNA-binding NtrC family response regulator
MKNNSQAIPAATSNTRDWQTHTEMCALVVDDNESIADMFAAALRMIGFSVLKAGNGMQAYECFLSHPVDLVITDVQMPLMDGLTLTQRINCHSPQTPVVIVTGHGFAKKDQNPAELSIFAVLHKPFRLSALQHIALQAVEQSHRRQNEVHCQPTN